MFTATRASSERGPGASRVLHTVSNPPQTGGGNSQTILLACRTRTMKRCSPGTRARLGALGVGWVRMLRAVKTVWASPLKEKRVSLEGAFIFQDLQLRTSASNRLIQIRECSPPTAPVDRSVCLHQAGVDNDSVVMVGRKHGIPPYQGVEKSLNLCSHISQGLNVREKVRLAPLLVAAALDGLFEHPDGR